MRHPSPSFYTLLGSVTLLVTTGLLGLVLSGSGVLPPFDLRVPLDEGRAVALSTGPECPHGLSAWTCNALAPKLPRALQLTYHVAPEPQVLFSIRLPRFTDARSPHA